MVTAFYEKIRQGEILGSIFNETIKEEKEWDKHLKTLTNFWYTNLFGIRAYKGNPTQKHIEVDHNFSNSLSSKHFERWLYLWEETLKNLFSRTRAEKAYFVAEKITSFQIIAIYKHR